MTQEDYYLFLKNKRQFESVNKLPKYKRDPCSKAYIVARRAVVPQVIEEFEEDWNNSTDSYVKYLG